MELKTLTDNLMVAGQIRPDDLQTLRDHGVTTIINNRPDGEMFGQPNSAELSAKAESLGMIYHYIPITPGHLDPKSIDEFRQATAEPDGQILAFCRTGTRSTHLWALAEAALRPIEEIVSRAENAGYDLRGMVPILQQLAQRG